MRHSRMSCFRGSLVLLLSALSAQALCGAVHLVPDDFASIQAALDNAAAGDRIQVRASGGPYFEKLVVPIGGNATDGHLSLEAFPGGRPVLDGTGVVGDNMILIEDKSYVRVMGFEIRNNLGVNDGSGVRILGAGSHLEIRDNLIHDMRGTHAMGITVYATSPTASIADLIIDGNEIYDCEPATSEALTLNGNVENFEVTNNIVRDVNNIGIDFIGGETDINPDPTKVARYGVVRGNQVHRANSNYGGGFAAGIYIDGARDIVIENNIVSGSDLGIEIGAENSGVNAERIIVRNNLLYGNEKICIVFGGYASSVGRTVNSEFLNNTCYLNDTLGDGNGELWIQHAHDNVVRNNIFWATDQAVMLASWEGNVNNDLDYNLWYTTAGEGSAEFLWNGTASYGMTAFRTLSGEAANSLFSDPGLEAPGGQDFRLAAGSVAIDRGDPGFVATAGELDAYGGARVANGRVDIGADEACDGVADLVVPAQVIDTVEVFEACVTIEVGAVVVVSPGEVVFRAGESVVLGEGVSVAGGGMSVSVGAP